MSSIDERVVEMKFDNAQFERGVSTTTQSLDKLKQSLNFDGAAKGLDNVATAANKFSLGPIGTAVDTIASKFNMMSVVAITAITNIVNKAINAGQQLIKSLTVAPITQGLQEYETNLKAVQTILANTSAAGTNLKDVNKALNELNTYSDQTIYNFSEMARNIGTFTAAGVDLKTATGSIKGIANLAALSGSSSEQASTAMYQLSQAISAGRVSLMDWNSVVNAGMGGTVFQRALAQTAVGMGKIDESAVKLSGKMKNVTIDGKSFRDSISGTNGPSWLTSDVLTNTLKQFTGDLTDAELAAQGFSKSQIKAIQDQAKTAKEAATVVKTGTQLIDTLRESAGSGWADTWQLIIGDFEEAKKLWTGASNVFGGLIQSSAAARNKVLGDWKALGGRTVMIDAIKNAWGALMAIIKPIKDAFRDIFPATTGKQLYNMSVAIRDFAKGLKIGADTAFKLRRIFQGVFAAFDIGWMVIKLVAKTLADLFGVASSGSGGILDMAASFADWITGLRSALKYGTGLTTFFGKLGVALAVPIRLLQNFARYLSNVFSGDVTGPAGATIDRLKARFEPLGKLGDLIATVWGKITQVFAKVWKAFAPMALKIQTFFSNLGDTIRNAMKDMDFSLVLDSINTGLFGVLVMSFKKFLGGFGKSAGDGEGLIAKIKGSFDALTDTLTAMQTKLKSDTLLKIAAAIGIMVIAVVALSMIDSAALTKALIAITIMFVQLGGAMALFEKISSGSSFGKMPATAASLVLLAIAVDILASAVKKLSDLSWEELAKGLVGVGGLLASLALFTKFAAADKGGVKMGAGLILLAIAIKILASAVKDFGEIPWENLGKGLAAITAVLAVVAIFSKTAGSGGNLAAASVGLVLIAVSMKILASAVKDFAAISWEDLGHGLAAMAGALVLITGALRLMPKNTLSSATSLVLIAGALKILASALGDMGGMSWEEIAKGLVTLGGSLLIITIAMQKMEDALPGAAALLVVSAALAVLAPILVTFSKMSWEEIGKGLLMLAGAFTILGLAGLVLTPVVPTLLLLGAAIVLMGVGLLAAGVGLLAFSAGITALSIAGAAGAAGITAIFAAIIGLIPMALKAVAEGLILMAQVIANSGPQLTEAMVTLITSLLNAINVTAPKIVNTLVGLVMMLVNVLVVNVPKFVDAGMRLMIGILNGIANNIGKLIAAAVNVVVQFLKGIGDNLPKVVQAGVDLIIKFIDGMSKAIDQNSAKMGAAGGRLAVAIVKGMVKGIAAGVGEVASAARDLAGKALQAAKNFLGIASPSKEFALIGKYSAQGMAVGLDKYSGIAANSAESMGHEAINSLRKSISGMSEIIDGHIDSTPTIRPVLDLSAVKKGASLIPGTLGAPALTVTQPYVTAAGIANDREAASAAALDPNNFAMKKTEVSYVQNNYSPKALTPMEIYRQTRNQISTVKDVLSI